ncbi:hypothetical protein BP6252_00939 [Coleophoma cylindrospora]|uniref:alpha,alpha-trehalase n=1 Tax=Coleophoma cylindrospora TaxID=1849047 RepID=A0A3D8SRI3_9HELO|nr:hypothetical protein BP6252_00939 [Coleophoma cylindrospora]
MVTATRFRRRAKTNPSSQLRKTIADPINTVSRDFQISSTPKLWSYDDERMRFTTYDFLPGNFPTRIHQANGYFGASSSMAEPFYEKDTNQGKRDSEVTEGWPLYDQRQIFSTISGFFDVQDATKASNFPELKSNGWESVISGIPHPLGFNLVVDGIVLNATVDSDTLRNFTQTLHCRNGITTWSYTWTPTNSSTALDIEFAAFLSRSRPTVAATQLRVTAREQVVNANIIDLLDGRNEKRSYLGGKGSDKENTIFVKVHPDNSPNIDAWLYSTANVIKGYLVENSRTLVTAVSGNNDDITVGQAWNISLKAGNTAVFQKFVGVASSDKFPDPKSKAESSSKLALQDGWEVLRSEHIQHWNRLMQRDLIADYRDQSGYIPVNHTTIEFLQAAAVVDRFYVLQNLLLEEGNNLNDQSISVGGLSSDSYGGLIFWDADTWVLRGIILTDPDYALQILKYRVAKYKQARANAQVEYAQRKYKFSTNAAIYPWTSGRYSNATATGPTLDYEYHLNTDIALSMLCPSLPVIKHASLPAFYFGGNRFKATMNATHTNLTRIPVELSRIFNDLAPVAVIVDRPDDEIPPQSYTLALNETVTIQNSIYWKNPTTPKNILQCQPTSAKDATKPGQLPGAATDGNSGTQWQPLSSNRTHHKVTLDESVPFQRIEEIRIEWGPRTPTRARIGFSNSTDVDTLDHQDIRTITLKDIKPNRVYGVNTPDAKIVPYVGNSTILRLGEDQEEYWSGRVAC